MPLLTWPWSGVYRAKWFGKKQSQKAVIVIIGNPAIRTGRREENVEYEGERRNISRFLKQVLKNQ